MLERMSDFFENRLDGYEEHMLTCIESAQEFYQFTAQCLPKQADVHILDLGCGTGLELNEYFLLNPSAKLTGIDLAAKMLDVLKQKFPQKELNLICGSYFDISFGTEQFDAAVSVESLHHFTKEEKIPLFTKLYNGLKQSGYFILTDYFSLSDREEQQHRNELLRLKKLEGANENEFYHYDTPLTVQHETEALQRSGFSSVEILNHWGATYTLKAIK